MLQKKQILKLSSQQSELLKVESFVESICDEFSINNNYFGIILIAVTEAVENAIKHGNHNEAEKEVIVTFESGQSGLTFTIADQGQGFDFNSVSDPTQENINPEQGRGIYLMKSLADEVNFGETGSQINLIFKIASINNELSVDRISQLKKYSEVKSKEHQENK